MVRIDCGSSYRHAIGVGTEARFSPPRYTYGCAERCCLLHVSSCSTIHSTSWVFPLPREDARLRSRSSSSVGWDDTGSSLQHLDCGQMGRLRWDGRCVPHSISRRNEKPTGGGTRIERRLLERMSRRETDELGSHRGCHGRRSVVSA